MSESSGLNEVDAGETVGGQLRQYDFSPRPRHYVTRPNDARANILASTRKSAASPSIHATCRLAGLLSGKTVHFDLDGDGVAEECPWLTSEACILVWDPHHDGHIDSGRRLFGSVSWWIFWRDGYQALEALDDNHDGVLSGNELHGLAIWRDLNGNGVSDPGEVTPIEDTDVESIAVHSTTIVAPGSSPGNSIGIRLKDGRTLPSYDWTLLRGISSPGKSESAQSQQ